MNESRPDETTGSRLDRRTLLQYGLGLLAGVPVISALAACGGDDGTASPTTAAAGGETTTTAAGATPTTAAGGAAATDAATTTVAAETTTTAAPVASDPTGILRFGAMRGTSYDPHRIGTQTEYPQLNVIYDTIVSIDRTTNEVIPRLAESWEVQDDRVRFTLRSGLLFQDGTPLDASAVKFSIDRAMSGAESNITTRLPMVASVEVVDEVTVDLVLAEPQPLPLLIQMSDRPGMIVSPTAVQAAGTSEAFSAAPIGAGMYKVEGQWFPASRCRPGRGTATGTRTRPSSAGSTSPRWRWPPSSRRCAPAKSTWAATKAPTRRRSRTTMRSG